MTQAIPAREGRCGCGNVRFTITAAPLLTFACHCRTCQRRTGSAFSLGVAIPSDGFHVSMGTTVPVGREGENRHHHCPDCMSWLFSELAATDAFVVVRVTMLDETDWATPFVEVFTESRLPWVTTPAVHSFAASPTPADYGALMAAYQARDAAG